MLDKAYRSLEDINKLASVGVVVDSGVDSSSKFIKIFPGKVEYSTVNALCNGQAGQGAGIKSDTNGNVISIANIGSGNVSGNLRVGESINICGPGEMITFGIPAEGIVGNNQPYMIMDKFGLYGGIGGTKAAWFYINYSQHPATIGSRIISGGDFFLGGETDYIFWDQSASKLTVAGDLLVYGDIQSGNWNPDWQTDPPMTGYKLVFTDNPETGEHGGDAYFAGAVVSGESTVGGRLANTIGSSINVNGNFVKDVINTSLDTMSGYILKLFDVKNTTQTLAGFRSGTLTWNSNGDIISGYGVAMTPFGLVGGVTIGGVPKTTFSISALSGDATFGGSLVAASGTFGTITAGSLGGTLLVGNRLATTIGGAINVDGNFTNQVINDSLNTSSKKILGGFTISADNTSASGFKAGNLTWNSSGTITGGAGVAMTPYGILGGNFDTNGQVPTFAINATTGAATFSGEIISGSETDYIKIDGINKYIGLYGLDQMNIPTLFGAISYNDSNVHALGLSFSHSCGSGSISEFWGAELSSPGWSVGGSNNASNIFATFEVNSIGVLQGASGIHLHNNDGVSIECNYSQGGEKIKFMRTLGPSSVGDILAQINTTGSYVGLEIMSGFGIRLGGVYKTEWPSGGGSSNLSDITINVAKDWGGYKITNLGAPANSSDAATAGYVASAASNVMSWVTSQGYATEGYVTSYVAVQRALIEAWVTANFVHK